MLNFSDIVWSFQSVIETSKILDHRYLVLNAHPMSWLFSGGYSEKHIQDIQDIRKNIQYQKIGGTFTSPNAFLRKLYIYQKQ